MVATVTVAIAGCGGGEEPRGQPQGQTAPRLEEVVVDLVEQIGSGETGKATLSPVGEDQTRVVVEVSGAPAPVQPAHIHTGSSCTFIGEPAAELNDVEDGKSHTTVDLSLESLQDGLHLIDVHQSEKKLRAAPAACGSIPRAAGK